MLIESENKEFDIITCSYLTLLPMSRLTPVWKYITKYITHPLEKKNN